MTIERWITNLEKVDYLKQQVEDAKNDVINCDPSQRKIAEHALYAAEYRLKDVERTMAQIAMETGGRFTIGEPMATQERTKEEIAADGIIGIYREGAGTGA